MNEVEELRYLTELLIASQNWIRGEGDDLPVLLEIRDRERAPLGGQGEGEGSREVPEGSPQLVPEGSIRQF